MNQVQLFIHEQLGDVRIIPSETGNQVDTLFCAVDVTRALGYVVNNHRTIVSRYCRYVTQCDVPHPQSKTKTLKVNFIPLSDVFNLIFKSQRPESEEFQRCISEEVLPSIYISGAYTDPNHDPNFKLSNKIYESSLNEYNDELQSVHDDWNEQAPHNMQRKAHIIDGVNKNMVEYMCRANQGMIDNVIHNQYVLQKQLSMIQQQMNQFINQQNNQPIVPAIIIKKEEKE